MHYDMSYWEKFLKLFVVFFIRFTLVPITTLRQFLVSLNCALKDFEDAIAALDSTNSLTASNIEEESEGV